jgi:hypothetical protein
MPISVKYPTAYSAFVSPLKKKGVTVSLKDTKRDGDRNTDSRIC